MRHASLQKDWASQQVAEKEALSSAGLNEAAEYAAQTEATTRMRGMLEDEMSSRKAAQLKELQAYNQMLAEQKRARETAWS